MELSQSLTSWQRIPEPFRRSMLSKIWCRQCRSFSVVNVFSCKASDGDLFLCGRCSRCGERIERPVPVCDV